MSNPAGTKRSLQVTGHRKCNKKVRHSADHFMLIYLFHSGYVIIRHMFGIDHASLCSKIKRSKLQKFLLSFECPEISKRSFAFASCEETWNKVLRMEWNNLVNAKSNRAKGESFKVRKQLIDKFFWNQFHWRRTEKLPSELATHVCFANYGLYCNHELQILVCGCTHWCVYSCHKVEWWYFMRWF